MIASKARAAQVIEQIADKHDITVVMLLCARWDRFAMLARAEAADALVNGMGWSIRTAGAYLGCSHTNVRKLCGFHKMQSARLARIGGAIGPQDPEGRIRELEAELVRLAGTLLCERLATKLRLRLRCAISLAIITEAYPRVVRGPAMLQLYDEACAQLGYGHADEGANYRLMDKNMSQLNAHFVGQGWPLPAVSGDGRGARQLSDDAAGWMSAHCGAPRLSVVLLAQEIGHDTVARSLPVRVAGAI
jgi:hypothetical protein